MAKHRLSKSTYIRSLQCQKSLYLHTKRPFLRDKISAEQLAKFRRGTDVGVLARELFPGGIDMTPKSPSAYIAKKDETLKLVNTKNINVLYEAVFEYDEVLIMLDILVRDGNGWKAIEVKSSRKLSTTYYNDAALQYYVLKGNNLTINSFKLIHINEDYVFDGTLRLEELFTLVEVMPKLEQMLPSTATSIATAKQTLDLDKSPDIPPGMHCFTPYPCDFLGHCWKNIPTGNLLQMRSINPEAASAFFANGRFLPEEILNEPIYNSIDQGELQAFKEHRLTTSAALPEALRKTLNRSDNQLFIKLLSLQPAVPFIVGFRPYQAVPIALSWSNGTKGSRVFEPDATGVEQARSLLNELFENNNLIITDDADTLLSFYFANPDTSHQSPITNHQSLILGIRQIVQSSPLYHPDFGRDCAFENIVRALTGKSISSEHWLRHDLQAAETEAQRHKVMAKLEQYPEVLSIITGEIRSLLLPV
ncbi:MAG: hypothetical protein LWX09_05680 [Bacteroidia bacterium]|jgi:hypothetical protein|nr:hypothetical protein [Bacteroidia bacterium]